MALFSGKTDKYEYLTGEEILPSDQSRTKEAKFTCSPLCKAFEKQIKTIADHRIKQVEALKNLKPKENKKLHIWFSIIWNTKIFWWKYSCW